MGEEEDRDAKELEALGVFSMWLHAAAGAARQRAEKNPDDLREQAKAEAFEEALEMLRKARPS